MRRKLTRRGTSRQAPSRVASSYEEEEEGYVSGDYEDAPFELIKIRVKVCTYGCSLFLGCHTDMPAFAQLHYQDDIRGMALTPETTFDEFMDKVTAKFGTNINGLQLKFKDEDGGKVSLRDESDYELAIETARESSRGRPEGKLEIWCTDK
jgi:hypothetical protein